MSRELTDVNEIIIEEGLNSGEIICPQCSKTLENMYCKTTIFGVKYECPDCEYEGDLENFHEEI